jgi:hypothetical protein
MLISINYLSLLNISIILTALFPILFNSFYYIILNQWREFAETAAKYIFFPEKMACRNLLLSLTSYLLYTYLRISFPASVVQWVFYRKIYSGGALGDRMSPITWLFFSAALVYTVRELGSLLHTLIQILWRSAWLPARGFWWHWQWKWICNLKRPQHGMCFCGAIKQINLPIAGFHSNKHSDHVFVYCTRT